MPRIPLISFLSKVAPGRGCHTVVLPDHVFCHSEVQARVGEAGERGPLFKMDKGFVTDTRGPLLQELTDAQRLEITGALSDPGTLTGSLALGSQLPRKFWSQLRSQPKAGFGCLCD